MSGQGQHFIGGNVLGVLAPPRLDGRVFGLCLAVSKPEPRVFLHHGEEEVAQFVLHGQEVRRLEQADQRLAIFGKLDQASRRCVALEIRECASGKIIERRDEIGYCHNCCAGRPRPRCPGFFAGSRNSLPIIAL